LIAVIRLARLDQPVHARGTPPPPPTVVRSRLFDIANAGFVHDATSMPVSGSNAPPSVRAAERRAASACPVPSAPA
jgi:hypothetical protein